eukprot:1133671-Pelagomonas_calceolata.AAC.4
MLEPLGYVCLASTLMLYETEQQPELHKACASVCQPTPGLHLCRARGVGERSHQPRPQQLCAASGRHQLLSCPGRSLASLRALCGNRALNAFWNAAIHLS